MCLGTRTPEEIAARLVDETPWLSVNNLTASVNTHRVPFTAADSDLNLSIQTADDDHLLTPWTCQKTRYKWRKLVVADMPAYPSIAWEDEHGIVVFRQRTQTKHTRVPGHTRVDVSRRCIDGMVSVNSSLSQRRP